MKTQLKKEVVNLLQQNKAISSTLDMTATDVLDLIVNDVLVEIYKMGGTYETMDTRSAVKEYIKRYAI